jgi:hypothetical protein
MSPIVYQCASGANDNVQRVPVVSRWEEVDKATKRAMGVARTLV